MKHKLPPYFVEYGIALIGVGIATGLRLWLSPILGDSHPYITFLPAVFAIGLLTGRGPVVFAVVLSALAASFLFIGPSGAPTPGGAPPPDTAGWVGLGLFVILGLGFALYAHHVRHQRNLMSEERERFSVTLANIGDAVIATNELGRITFMNEVSERLTGWVRSDSAGQSLLSVCRLVNEKTGEPVDDPTSSALREGRIVRLADDVLLLSKDGVRRAVDVRAAPIHGGQGRILGAMLILRDVTEQRSMQEARGRLAALVDSSDDAILGQTFDGVVTSWNVGAERLFGYTAEETIGRSIFATIVPPDRRDELLDVLRRVERGEQVGQFETERVCKNGRRLAIAVQISPIVTGTGLDAEVVGASAIDRDLSEQRAAERRRNARLAVDQILTQETDVGRGIAASLAAICAAFDSAAGGFWSLDSEHDVLRCEQFHPREHGAMEPFRSVTLAHRFKRGAGLPGRAWQALQPMWVAVAEPGFERAAEAQAVGLHAALALPIVVDERLLGVMELFSRNVEAPGDDLLETMATIGGQIAQYIERRRNAEQLWRSERDLADFFEHAAIAQHSVGPDGTILRANQREMAMLGYSADEYIGRNIAEFHVDRHVIDDILKTLRNGGQVRDREARLRCRDGTVRHALIDSNALWQDGQLVYTRGFTRDVTEHREAEARIHSVVDNVVDGIVTIDEHGTIDSFNRAAERIFGYSSSEVVGRNVHMLMPEPYHHQHDNFLANYLSTGVPRIIGQGREVAGRHKDGSTFPLDLAVSEFQRDGQRYFTGVVRDITERKQTQQSLQFLADASRSLAMLVDFKDTLHNVTQLAVPGYADWCAVHLIGPSGSLEQVAIAHADPAKIPLSEELARRYPLNPDMVLEVIRTGESQLVSHIDDAMLQQISVNEEQLAMLRELKLHSYMRVPLRQKDSVLGAITFASGESGRRYGPEDLRTMEDLANRATIAIENAQLYQELRDTARRKDEFLATLAHELRNPLTPIRTGLYILEKRTQGESETIAMMQQQVSHIVRLVEDLVDVSRIMRGKVELRREPVELSAIVTRSLLTVESRMDERKQKLVLSMPQQPVWLHADPVRLVQVVENLLHNASKYMEPGGSIEVSARTDANHAILVIRDHGIGIDQDLLPKIFDLFTQASRSLDRSQGGLGIGLTLVKQLVELHGGTITATSAGRDQGSTFVVRLPITAAPRHTNAETPAQRPTTRRRVVVVDDNASALALVSDLVRTLGDHEVVTATDGPSALAAAKVHHPDIILLDIGLPGMDGYEVARVLRDAPEFDDVLIVALTGYAKREDRQRSSDAGFDGHLVKPPAIEDLNAVLTHPRLRQI